MKHQKTLTALLAIGLISSLSGCAAIVSSATNTSITEEKAIEKTAKYFAVDKKAIKLVSYDKGTIFTDYQVKIADKIYNCTIQYGEIQGCRQPGH